MLFLFYQQFQSIYQNTGNFMKIDIERAYTVGSIESLKMNYRDEWRNSCVISLKLPNKVCCFGNFIGHLIRHRSVSL